MKLDAFLKKAIEEQDWDNICKVYTSITGEPIEPPKPKNIPEDDSNLANLEIEEKPIKKETGRQGKKRRFEGDFIAPSKKSKKVGTKEAKKTSIEIPPIGKRPNRFNDNQTIAKKELVTNNPQLGVSNPMPRGSRSSLEDIDAPDTGKFVEVTCALCNKQFNMSPTLAHGYDPDPDENVWKCNDCCTGSGRTKLIRQRRNT